MPGRLPDGLQAGGLGLTGVGGEGWGWVLEQGLGAHGHGEGDGVEVVSSLQGHDHVALGKASQQVGHVEVHLGRQLEAGASSFVHATIFIK